GRCYQNLGEPDKAISSFREYLRQATDTPPDQRAKVEGYIREMEELKRKRQQGAAPAAPAPDEAAIAPPRAPAPPPRDAAATGARLSDRRSVPADEGAPGGGSARRKVALALVGLGAVGVGLGAWYGLDARSKWNDANAS